jgi:hypothetical protein
MKREPMGQWGREEIRERDALSKVGRFYKFSGNFRVRMICVPLDGFEVTLNECPHLSIDSFADESPIPFPFNLLIE